MGQLGLEPCRYKGWDAWAVRNGPLELRLVPQVGGRIMGVLWRGHELAFTQPEREGQLARLSDVADLAAHKRAMGFPLWGGDKTWLAPQERWTEGVPFLDLDSGRYALRVERAEPERTVIVLESPICRETGIVIERTLALSQGLPGWRIRHRLVNRSAAPVEWAVWDVLMLRRPGRVYLPLHPRSVFPEGVKEFANEGSLCDLGACSKEWLAGLAVVRCEEPRAFKAGVDSREAWMLGVVETPLGLVGCARRMPPIADGVLPHGCSAEVFNAAAYDYLELELLAPLARIEPGGSVAVEERTWLFDLPDWPADEAGVRQRVAKPGA